MAGDSKIQNLRIVKSLCRVIELQIGKDRPFLFITSLVHSLGTPILPKRLNYDRMFSYLHSLASMLARDVNKCYRLLTNPLKSNFGEKK